MAMKVTTSALALLLSTLLGLTLAVNGQTTAFNYQGRLTDGGNSANGSFQMQFKLFDALAAGSQIGSTLNDVAVTVTNGTFSVKLDFGTSPFTGANRFLEVAVRRNSGESYVTLTPREQITSSPFSLRTLSAALSDDSQKLGGVAANQYATIASISNSFIKNDTILQIANFNISGNGRVGGTFGIGTTTPNSGFEIKGTGLNVQQRITDTTSGNSLVLQGGAADNLKVTGFNYNSFTPIPLYLSTDGANTYLNASGGSVGIGTAVPTHTLDVNGFIRAFNSAGGNVVSETTGGTNSWAKLWVKQPSQNWSIGSSNNFNGNQLYFANESTGNIRMALMPNGNLVQNAPAYGVPKAMLYVQANGWITRCYNGQTGASLVNNQTTSGCGYTVSHTITSFYDVTVDFDVSQRFFFATQNGAFVNNCGGGEASISSFGGSTVRVLTSCGNFGDDRPFWLIIY